MLKQNLGWVMGKNEPTENLEKLSQWKIHVSGFPSVDGISASFGSLVSILSAIMKKLKNGYHFVNINRTEKFQITNPPKV